MIEGHDTIMGTYEAMTQRVHDRLPDDPECQRLYMKWNREFRTIAKSGRPTAPKAFRECSDTYAQMKACLELEGVKIYD